MKMFTAFMAILVFVALGSVAVAQENIDEEIGNNEFTMNCTTIQAQGIGFCVFSLEDIVEEEEEENSDEDLIDAIREFLENNTDNNEDNNSNTDSPPWT